MKGDFLPGFTLKTHENDSLLSKYCKVAEDLPDWAGKILESRMGSVSVSPSESFQLYLFSAGRMVPRDEYLVFRRKFRDIFEEKGSAILGELEKNRKEGAGSPVSNDHFWREFLTLFSRKPKIRERFGEFIYRFASVFRVGFMELLRVFDFGWPRSKLLRHPIFNPSSIKSRANSYPLDPNKSHVD